MKRYVPGLGHANASTENNPADGLFLGRVERVQYCRQGQKPYYLLLFKVARTQNRWPATVLVPAFTARQKHCGS